MALLREFRSSYSDLRESFARRAAEGRQYLLVIEQVCASPYMEDSDFYVRAVDSLAEIMPLLKQQESRNAQLYLRGVLDLSGKFEEQASYQRDKMEALLDPPTKQALDAFYSAQTLRKSQADWRELPRWKRWITPFPQATA